LIAPLLAASLWNAGATAGDRPAPAAVIVEAQSNASRNDAIWILSSGAADIVSTEIGLNHCGGSCVEANPLGKNTASRIAIKAAYSSAAWFAIRNLRRKDHKTWANVLRWTVVSMNSAMVANNISVMVASPSR
jgi:hypothetical protein